MKTPSAEQTEWRVIRHALASVGNAVLLGPVAPLGLMAFHDRQIIAQSANPLESLLFAYVIILYHCLLGSLCLSIFGYARLYDRAVRIGDRDDTAFTRHLQMHGSVKGALLAFLNLGAYAGYTVFDSDTDGLGWLRIGLLLPMAGAFCGAASASIVARQHRPGIRILPYRFSMTTLFFAVVTGGAVLTFYAAGARGS